MASQRLVPKPGPASQAELITSRQNPRFKFLRSLHKRKYRQREGRFLVEGIRIVARCADQDVVAHCRDGLAEPVTRIRDGIQESLQQIPLLRIEQIGGPGVFGPRVGGWSTDQHVVAERCN